MSSNSKVNMLPRRKPINSKQDSSPQNRIKISFESSDNAIIPSNNQVNIPPRHKGICQKIDLTPPKLSGSFESLKQIKKSHNNSVGFLYSSTLNLPSKDKTHKLTKNKSLSKIIPEYEDKSRGGKKNEINSSDAVYSNKTQNTSGKDVIPSKIQELVKRLKEPSTGLLESQDICNKLFDEVIKYSPTFEHVLKLIKSFYNTSLEIGNKSLKDFQLKFEAFRRKKEEIEFENNNLAFENIELNDKISELSDKVLELHRNLTDATDKLIKIEKIDMNFEQMNEKNWKKIIQSHNIIQESLYILEKKVKHYKNKAFKMAKLLSVLENKGFPVRDVYLSELSSKKPLIKNVEDGPEDDTENEDIVSGKIKKVPVPAGIPKLDFEVLSSRSFTSEEPDSLS